MIGLGSDKKWALEFDRDCFRDLNDMTLASGPCPCHLHGYHHGHPLQSLAEFEHLAKSISLLVLSSV